MRSLDLSVQPIRNIMRNPRVIGLTKDVAAAGGLAGPEIYVSSYSSGTFRIVDITDLPGFTRAIELVSNDTTSRGVIVGSAEAATATAADGSGSPRVIMGQKYTVSAWAKVNRTAPIFFGIRFHDAPSMQGTYRGENSPTTPTLTAGTWTRISTTITVGAGQSTWVGAFIGIQARTGSPQAGDTFQLTGLRITAGTDSISLDGQYMDGNVPGWRWVGTPDASESVGYPYTLESIAGTSIVSISGDTGVAPVSLTILPALAGRTTYCVSDRVLLNNTGGAILHAHSVVQGSLQTGHIRTSGTTGAYEFRPQFIDGGGAGAAYADAYPTIPGPGTRNVYAVAQAEGLASYEHEVNGGALRLKSGLVVGQGYTEGAGITVNRGTASTVLYESPVYTVQFKGFHSWETRKRVTAWLARRYGTPIPSGY